MRIGVAAKLPVSLASARFRLLIPSTFLDDYEYSIGSGDITFFPKHLVPLNEVQRFKGVKLWDVCDDHFDNPKLRDYYRTMPGLVDHITCTTKYLQMRLDDLGFKATVITDPLEFPTQNPKIGHEKLFWYGHSSNIDPLYELDLDGYELVVVTDQNWSTRNMREGFRWCDCVIIPVKSDLEKASALAKSPNRMTEAINAGRFVVANPMPAYEGYGMWLGDIREGLKWLESNPEEAMERLKNAQKLAWEKHNPKTVASQWKDLFDSILGVGTSSGKDS